MDERRAEILRAACDLVDEGGVQALTMRRLGERIGFTPPIIYEHFAGKERLLEAVGDTALGQLAEVVAGARATGEDLLVDTARAVLDHASVHRGMIEATAFAKDGPDTGPGATALMAELRITLLALDDSIAEATVKLRAEIAWATIEGVAHQVERGIIDPARAHEILDQAFSAYRSAWTA